MKGTLQISPLSELQVENSVEFGSQFLMLNVLRSHLWGSSKTFQVFLL